MNTNDLYLEYARVIEMCKGTELEDTPWQCVKLDNIELAAQHGHPKFDDIPKNYKFAVAALEGKPVFEPKRTFTLNSVELPCPKPKFKEGTDWTFDISGDLFGFDTKEECDSVYQAIIKLLTEARDK